MGVGAIRKINHAEVVEIAKSSPGKWQLAGIYRSRHTAQSVGVQIRRNKYSPAYKTGNWDTTYLPLEDGDWELWVQFLGESE